MKTFYDVQQFLKRFGIIVYAGLMDKLDYLEAEAVLRREHKVELIILRKMEK